MNNEPITIRLKHCEVILYPDIWDVPSILAEIEKRTTIDKYVIAFHDSDVKKDGSPVTPHYHVYLHFTTAWSPEHIAGWFNTSANKVSKIKADKGNPQQGMYYTLLYYTHSENHEKHFYPPESFTANFDVAAYLVQEAARIAGHGTKSSGKSARIDEILEKCGTGKITPLNYYKYMTPAEYARHAPLISRAFRYHQDMKFDMSEGKRNITTIWIHGPSGLGKTTLAKLYAKQLDLPFYVTHPGNDPFDDYRQQPVVIVDELRPDSVSIPYSSLLLLIDPYNLSGVHSRFEDKIPDVEYVFVCTVYSPIAYYRECTSITNRAIDSDVQLCRRISELWEVTPQSIFISNYNLSDQHFELDSIVNNPTPYYIAQQKGNTLPKQDTKDVLKQLNETYCDEEKQISLFDDV